MKTIEPRPGARIDLMCEQLVREAPATMVFNGTRVESRAGDTTQAVYDRWNKNRDEQQRAKLRPEVEYHYRCPNMHTGVVTTLAQELRCPTCDAQVLWVNGSFNGEPFSWRIGDGVSIVTCLSPDPMTVAIEAHAAQKKGGG